MSPKASCSLMKLFNEGHRVLERWLRGVNDLGIPCAEGDALFRLPGLKLHRPSLWRHRHVQRPLNTEEITVEIHWMQFQRVNPHATGCITLHGAGVVGVKQR